MKEKRIRIKVTDEVMDEVRVQAELLEMQPIDVLAMGIIQSVRQQAEERGMRIRIVPAKTNRLS